MHTKTRSEYKLGLGLDTISVHIICDRDSGDVISIQRRDLTTEYSCLMPTVTAEMSYAYKDEI
jgi:hypothetical protein